MKKIIPLIFSVFYIVISSGQAVGGWGTCEFATVVLMNAFDPSANAYDCKKVFVQATDEHYYWNGTIWVLVIDTDDQTAAQVTYDNTTSGLTATDVQAAIDELNTLSSLDNIYNTDGTLDVDRTVTMDGNDFIFDGTGTGDIIIESDGNFGVGTLTPAARFDVDGGQVRFSDYGIGNYDDASPARVLGVQADGDVIEINLSTLEDNLGNHVAEENIQMTDYWISNDGDDEGIFVNSSGDVGIGTDTPGGALEVSGGEVIFSDYGSGTYIDSNPSYYLGVDATGDIVEVSSEPNSVLSIESTEITLNGTDQDDYSPTGFPTSRVYRLSPTSDTDITGIDATGVVHGQLVTFLNVSDSVNKHVEFKSNDTNSSAANRIYGQNDADCKIDKGESVTFIYDGVDSIWRIYSWVK